MTRFKSVIEASLMVVLIMTFLVVIVSLSFTIWSIIGLPEGPFNTFMTLLGLVIAFFGLYGIIWVYMVFPPHAMLSHTIRTLPEEVSSLFHRKDCRGYEYGVEVVDKGPYKCVRHPLYSSVTLFFFGLSFIKAPLLIATVLLYIIYNLLGYMEERYLSQVTCGRYDEIMRGVPSLNPLSMLACILRDLMDRLRGRA